MSRHKREFGTLPRPLAVLAALALTGATGLAIRMLPAGATPEPRPAALPAPSPPPRQAVAAEEPPPSFVGFVDTVRDPGFDLPAESRRTGVTLYALGHLVSGGDDGCVPRWAGAPRPGGDPVASRLGGLRAAGGDAYPVFGGPAGRELAVACTRPGGLATAYRRAVGEFGATSADFEIRDADAAAALRRARAIHALQQELPLRVSFTLRLERDGLDEADLAMLRATRRAGARVDTVNLLAEVEPRGAPEGRLSRLASAVRAAAGQVAQAHDLPDHGQAWRRIALTPVLGHGGDLDESDAHKLSAYAVRHGLAWLSLRGAAPKPDVSRILWRTRS